MAANKSKSGDKSASDSKKAAHENEFVSDTFKTSEQDLEEVKAGMKILGIDTLVKQKETPLDGSAAAASVADASTAADGKKELTHFSNCEQKI